MKTFLLTFILALCMSGALLAQSDFSMMYSMGLPTGDLNSFINKPSFRGIVADYRYRYTPNIAFGITLGWNTFYEERSSGTYTVENASLSGKQFRYSNHVPMYATMTYYMEGSSMFKPFGTMGIGTMYSRRNTDMNIYTVELQAWHFAIQPEIGVQIRTSEAAGPGGGFTVSAKYNHGFKAGSELRQPQSFFSINLGFVLYDN